MTVVTNTTDRKALVKALAEELGTTAKYTGVPYCNYKVGNYTVDRDGNIVKRFHPTTKPEEQRQSDIWSSVSWRMTRRVLP